jgi:hypothetical protein
MRSSWNDERSAADVVGPWVNTPGEESGLVRRCKEHWGVPINKLSNAMLAVFLRQRIALPLVIHQAQLRLAAAIVDGTELYEDELANALKFALEAH